MPKPSPTEPPRDGPAPSTLEQPVFAIHLATAADIPALQTLFRAYAAWLAIDLSYQSFTAEVSTLPGAYAAPHGVLLLAQLASTRQPIGCAALRPLLEPGVCEMKRLYVVPETRGLGVGRKLVDEVIRRAKEKGYRECRLDTLPIMENAGRLYREAGFRVCEKYYESPVRETVFMRCLLATEVEEGEGAA